jgi:hypothetical protein
MQGKASVEQFDLSQAFSEYADASAVAEANSFKTIPTATYTIQITKAVGQKFAGDDRPLVHMTADVLDNGRKVSTVFFNASWVARRRDTDGRLDSNFTRWAQILRILYPELSDAERAKMSVTDVVDTAMKFPLGARITESFQVPNGDGSLKWVTPRTADEAVQYRTAGLQARNFVQSITRA